MKLEYSGQNRVYLIDDGEWHHYVATSPKAAMDHHLNEFGGNDDAEIRISDVDPGKRIVVRFDDPHDAVRALLVADEPAELRELNIVGDAGGVTLGLYACVWARATAEGQCSQIGSTVW